jgi:cobalt-zinc-cadmium resistance protein CzcA
MYGKLMVYWTALVHPAALKRHIIGELITTAVDRTIMDQLRPDPSDVVIKIFGDDIDTLNRLAKDVAASIQNMPGAVDVFALRNAGMRYFTVAIDRAKSRKIPLEC